MISPLLDRTKPNVAFITKPIEPPWTDGTKNLVRDLACALSRQAIVYSTQGLPLAEGRPTRVPRSTLPFGAAVLLDLTVQPPPLLHFFFAPNERSCSAAMLWLKALRLRGWRGRTIQTVASRPSRWSRKLFFGDHVVVQSEWAKSEAASLDLPRLSVIPPAIPLETVSANEVEAVRRSLNVTTERIVVYPGDLEFSKGAWTSARAFTKMANEVEDALLVLACRPKTEMAKRVAADIATYLRAANLEHRVRFAGEVSNMRALLAASALVVFPVEDLYGKVDHPLVLLEAQALGVPAVISNFAPLLELPAAAWLNPGDTSAWAIAIANLLSSPKISVLPPPTLETFAEAYDSIYRAILPA